MLFQRFIPYQALPLPKKKLNFKNVYQLSNQRIGTQLDNSENKVVGGKDVPHTLFYLNFYLCTGI
jgi:hypothetical protein